MHDEVARHNRRAWDGLVERANRWTVPVDAVTIAAARRGAGGVVGGGDRWAVPVDAVTIAAARRGEWEIVLTPTRPVPRAWYPPFAGERVLLLAGAGGQQAPVLAAAGARV